MEVHWLERKMVEKKLSLETRMLMDFFKSQGVTFVDVESGEEIEPMSDDKEGE